MSNLSEEEKKAIEILEKFITEHKLFNIKSADNLENNIKILLNLIERQQVEINKEKEKNNNILGLVFECGQIDGEHHKTWVIDQIVRILTENDYDKWVQHYEYDEATGEEYTWDIGIAP